MATAMNRYERTLVLLLRLDAILLLMAMIPSMMPFEWMKEIHRCLGLGELPDGPIMGYLTRSLSVMYAMHGAVELFVYDQLGCPSGAFGTLRKAVISGIESGNGTRP
ncbi:MAG: hypothetical protein ACLQNE_11360 [Thermoguttaceae bacterium]